MVTPTCSDDGSMMRAATAIVSQMPMMMDDDGVVGVHCGRYIAG